MLKENINDLIAFLAVAQELSFTRAAGKLGLSQPALSLSMKNLEERMGIRLLTRTTRSVIPTEAGERLVKALGPHFHDIEVELHAMKDLLKTPSGNIKITAGEHVMDYYVWPKLLEFIELWPEINIEVTVDNGLTDIVKNRYDAGIRMGNQISDNMVAIPVTPEIKMAVVGSPCYFSTRTKPKVPSDLELHTCINMRLPTFGSVCIWEFSQNGDTQKVKVTGQLTINALRHKINAAISGFGLIYVPEDTVIEEVKTGELIRVLEDWCESRPGYSMYYPTRKQHTTAFSMLIKSLRCY
ncbi:LysR family transcriptional regulator [Rahnella sp. RcJ3]|jgi:DNA-binding transcriptional LysR family regulator|uniref:LysR family transcriptional regulator n=1 Tax=Rahnella sp. RcJ3 TaxID=2292446 RepID=UPI00129600D6|nr:LysR family transcriptional regulator [Rahnella sp. RcJ3]MQB56070.1 LysR family transcriptional regulator [Rahnella sp. RcJ3]